MTDAARAGPGSSAIALRRDAAALASPLPALLVEAERVATAVAQGVHGRRRVGPGESFWSFRRYGAGDGAQRIDWRQSAKSRHLYVRENEWEAAESVWLWCDGSASMAYRSPFAKVDKRWRANVILCALAMLLVRGGERIAALEGSDPPAMSELALNRLARAFLTPRPDDANLPPPRALPRDSALIIASDFLAPVEAWRAQLQPFAEGQVRGHLLQVLDPAEEDLPFTGRTRFEGIEERLIVTAGRAEDLRTEYRAALLAHRAALSDLARHWGWTFAHHRTDRPATTALLSLYGGVSQAIGTVHAGGAGVAGP